MGVAKILGIRCCANDGIAALLEIERDIHPLYLHYYFNSITKKLREVVATGNGQPNLNTALIGEIIVPIPSTKEEQIAIANILFDNDLLIESLEKLVEKKKKIKQGAMQQLLTGKKRLPGFNNNKKFKLTELGAIPEDWKVENIRINSTLKARIGWQGLTTAEYLRTGKFYLVTGTDFKNSKIDWNTCVYVDGKRFFQDRNIQLKIGDILVTKDGTIGKVAYINALPLPSTLNSGIFVIRPKGKAYYPLFLFYILSSDYFTRFLNKLAAGSTINHLYQKDFQNFNFVVPEFDEQVKIAKILFDSDSEIGSFERKRDKCKQLKVGLMQQLLTGRIRLKWKS